ncbi:MAG: GNAT family N-acetyltransferase [Rhodospirillaceae bacterium]|nr:GNAT family N-acetyltransferase [Rhodospirillaceae bacterium]MBT3886292.1 GNAT family N-acetyltransferase [Rhodospirillaceae bacterium]MBT4118952.1 GNAT family N-acetyltransferase [Rhodospirillaceae bacterium]MBT4673777.1 GNAT family N-acetyltransferase [Rhodospirillaceae bacterium]MBT4718629.1 GNAT family N-acetyltransferase [Rhodospirillaceae bacterium]
MPDTAANPSETITIRAAGEDDCERVTALDALITGLRKESYWRQTFERYIGRDGRHVLIAESAGDAAGEGGFAGFIIGEVRAWEFGSQPCGWIVAIGVVPEQRVHRIGERLFNAMCEKLEADGVETVRTMIARADHLNMSFFRAQGMMAGPFIELEKPVAWKFENEE